ncbi:MAG: hypothetical protein H7Y04_10060 [Verrucomicrobia bacterium]|nr:hypothetical protein [Cytophagales bacterium]
MGLFLISLQTVAQAGFKGFKQEQLKIKRVATAYKKTNPIVSKLLTDKKIAISSLELFFRVFKSESQVEMWAKDNNHKQFVLLKTYEICHASGDLGPKRKEGDLQVPEGFYHFTEFNPLSSYHLSLYINYPNVSDRILSNKKEPGGLIYMHGNCVSIGCLAMTDEKIEEIYLLAMEACNLGQTKIPIHIFPTRFTEINWTKIQSENAADQALINFWKDLKIGYDYFEKNKTLPKISVDGKGKYKVL